MNGTTEFVESTSNESEIIMTEIGITLLFHWLLPCNAITIMPELAYQHRTLTAAHSRNLLYHFAAPRYLARRLCFTCEYTAYRSLQPLVWNSKLSTLRVLNIPYKQWVCAFNFGLGFLT